MAKLFAEVVIAGNYKRLSKATRGANKEMSGLAKASKKMSNIMKASIAGIGFAQLTSQLVQATKAADEDRRSMALLNKQLDTSWKANDKTKQSVDEFITSMMLMSGVADDELRPAYSKIASQTKSMTKANKMFSLAMDIAADRGVSLETATKAVTKAMAGNESAFSRLYPAAKDSGDAIAYVTAKSKGAAKIAGDNSPFARLTVQFDEMKETIGKELLPYVDELAKWMNSKEGQKTVKETTKALVELIREAAKLAKWALDNKEILLGIGIALKTWQISSGIITSWKTLSGIWKGMKAPKIPGGVGLPQGPTMPGGKPPKAPTGGKIPPILGTGLATVASAALVLSIPSSSRQWTEKEIRAREDLISRNEHISRMNAKNNWNGVAALGAAPSAPNSMQLPFMQPGNITINVNAPNVSGPAVVDALKQTARRKGVPLKLLLN